MCRVFVHSLLAVPGQQAEKPLHTRVIRLENRLPLGRDPIDIERGLIGGHQGLDVGLVLEAEGEQLQQNQALRRGHANAAPRSRFHPGMLEDMPIRGQECFQLVDAHPVAPQHCHVMPRKLRDDVALVELEAQAGEGNEHRGQRDLGKVEDQIDSFV